MTAHRHTRNQIAEVQEMGQDLQPYEQALCNRLAARVAAGHLTFSVQEQRQVDAMHSRTVGDRSTLVPVPGEEPTLFDKRVQPVDAVTHDGGPDRADGAPSDGDLSDEFEEDFATVAKAKRKATKKRSGG